LGSHRLQRDLAPKFGKKRRHMIPNEESYPEGSLLCRNGIEQRLEGKLVRENTAARDSSMN